MPAKRNEHDKTEKPGVIVKLNQSADISVSSLIATNAGGRIIESKDFDNLSYEAANAIREVLGTRGSFYIGDSMLTPDRQLKLARKLREITGYEFKFNTGNGPHLYITMQNAKGIELVPGSGRTKVDTVIIVADSTVHSQTGTSALSYVQVGSKETGRYVANMEQEYLQELAGRRDKSIASTIETLMNIKFLDDNKTFAIVVDSRDAQDVFAYPGFYKIDRSTGTFNKIATSDVMRELIWYEVIHISESAIGALRKGRPMVLTCHYDGIGSKNILITSEVPYTFKAVLALTNSIPMAKKIVEMRRAELMEEVEDAEKEREELSKLK